MLFSDIIISTDIEADGPIPGPHSMWSLGSGAFVLENKRKGNSGRLISSFSVNLEDLPGAQPHPETLAWWQGFPEEMKAARKNLQPPLVAMQQYVAWLENLGKNIMFAAWPATYDFMFVYWYLMKFVGRSPFGFAGFDMKSYAMGTRKEKSWRRFSMKSLPPEWSPAIGDNTKHIAVNDAIYQGYVVCNMIADNLS